MRSGAAGRPSPSPTARAATISDRIVTHALRRIAARSAGGRAAAARLEALRTVGVRGVRTRLRQEAAFAGQSPAIFAAVHRAIWDEAAEAVGAKVEPIGPGLDRISRGEQSTIVAGKRVALDDAVTLRVARDKRFVHELLSAEGLAVPDQLAFDATDPGEAARFLRSDKRACVVKPLADSGGGSGITGGIDSVDGLRRAALKAYRWSDRLILEREAPGLVYRLLFLEGRLLDVVQRRPPELVGDGRSDVRSLVAQENDLRMADRSLVGGLLRLDLDAALTLGRQGLSTGAVPGAGRRFQVKSATSQNARRDNAPYRDTIAPELVDQARAAVDLLGLRLAGVDLVTPDPSRPLGDVDGAIIEVNGEPGLQHHYCVADRDAATRVAIPILERLLTGS